MAGERVERISLVALALVGVLVVLSSVVVGDACGAGLKLWAFPHALTSKIARLIAPTQRMRMSWGVFCRGSLATGGRFTVSSSQIHGSQIVMFFSSLINP